MDYTYSDYLAVERTVLNDRFVGDFDDTPAMFFMGDWFYGDMKAKGIRGLSLGLNTGPCRHVCLGCRFFRPAERRAQP